MTQYLLGLDQGTSSSRAIIFDTSLNIKGCAQLSFTQHYPRPGWIEHDPKDLWQTSLTACHQAIQNANVSANEILGMGITNQRETTIVWDRKTGEAIYPAIVWQDRRTTEICEDLKKDQLERRLQTKTGLIADPYFSATKLQWLLDNIAGARRRAEKGELAFGTVDSFLLWHLTGGKTHATDITNASRTLLFNIQQHCWDEDLLELFKIPRQLLPEVKACQTYFGDLEASLLGAAIPILAIAGDQQAASIGQCCFQSGNIKCTYGTGGFLMMNTGSTAVQSKHQLLTTIGYKIHDETAYALEGSILSAGSTIQWLRDAAGIITTSAETADLAASVPDSGGVKLIPAFAGMGAPYWDPNMRGAIVGLSRNSTKAHIVRAALEALCYQTKDLIECMQKDAQLRLTHLRVDGGMVKNTWLMKQLANCLQIPIQVASIHETTVLGVAMLAGLGAGVFDDFSALSSCWKFDEQYFPKPEYRVPMQENYANWRRIVESLLT